MYIHSEFVYEAIPLIYIIIGFGILMTMGHALALMSGWIFIAAGLLVGYWRYGSAIREMLGGSAQV